MGSLTFSEMATIAIIVLIVFGPRRLPELARRAGAMMSKLRQATNDLREEFRNEYQETLAPLEEVRRDFQAAKDDLTSVARAVGQDLEEAGDDLTSAMRAGGEDPQETPDTSDEASEEATGTRAQPAQPTRDEPAPGKGETAGESDVSRRDDGVAES